jgi:TctA family transporter
MHYIFLLARVYPYWALPLTIVLVQLFIFFRRRKNPMRFTTGAGAVILVLGIFAWFIFRGDIHSDDWIRTLLGRS